MVLGCRPLASISLEYATTCPRFWYEPRGPGSGAIPSRTSRFSIPDTTSSLPRAVRLDGAGRGGLRPYGTRARRPGLGVRRWHGHLDLRDASIEMLVFPVVPRLRPRRLFRLDQAAHCLPARLREVAVGRLP